MSEARTIILRLALAAAERGDAASAADALRGLLAMTSERSNVAPTQQRAVTRKTLAELLDCTPRHVSNLERRGQIAPEAILGSGAGKRYIVDKVFASLGRVAPTPEVVRDEIADDARAYVRRRAKLRVIGGSS